MRQPDAVPAAVEAVLAGESARFADIVRAFDAPVRRVVARTLPDRHALEDVVQEVWIRLFEKLGQLREVRRREAWVGRIAFHCASDFRRRQQRAQQHLLAVSRSEPGDAAVTGERLHWVWELIGSLPERDRELLTWRYADELSYREIAARLSVQVSTVRGRLYEARRLLRQLIERRQEREENES